MPAGARGDDRSRRGASRGCAFAMYAVMAEASAGHRFEPSGFGAERRSLPSVVYEGKRKATRRERFLSEMDRVIP